MSSLDNIFGTNESVSTTKVSGGGTLDNIFGTPAIKSQPSAPVAAPVQTKTLMANTAPPVDSSTLFPKSQSLFSKIISLPGKAVSAAGDVLANIYGPNIQAGLATTPETAAEKVLKPEAALVGGASPENLPFGVGAVVSGYKDIYHHPDDYAPPTFEDVLTGIVQTSKEVEKMPIKAAANLAGVPLKFNVPVLGEVTNRQFDAARRISNGENPVLVAGDEGINSIFDTLILAGLANEVAGPKQVTTQTGTMSSEEASSNPLIKNAPNGAKSFHLFDPVKSAQPVAPSTIERMINEKGFDPGEKYDPKLPTFFRGTEQASGSIKFEVVQIKPSILNSISEYFSKNTSAGYETTQNELLSSGHDFDRAIESGDMPLEKIYKPDGTLVPHEVEHTVSDLALKLDQYKPGLGAQYKNSVDINNATPTTLINQASQLLTKVASGNTGLNNPIMMPALSNKKIDALPPKSVTVIASKTVNPEKIIKATNEEQPPKEFHPTLLKEAAAHITEHGEDITHRALMDNLGIPHDQANEVIQAVRKNYARDNLKNPDKHAMSVLESIAPEIGQKKIVANGKYKTADEWVGSLSAGNNMTSMPYKDLEKFFEDNKPLSVVENKPKKHLESIFEKKEIKPEPAKEQDAFVKTIESTPESKKISESKAVKGFEYNPESGFVSLEPIAKAATNVEDFIKETNKGIKASKNLDDNLYTLTKQNEADKILAVELAKKVDITPEDAEAIYHYEEDKSLPLSTEQKDIYEQSIKPLADASAKIAHKLKDIIPVDTEGYTPRFVKGKGNVLDRIKAGAQGIGGKGSVLGKNAPSLKHRTMKAVVDKDGNRSVVSIKDGKITKIEGKKSTIIGYYSSLKDLSKGKYYKNVKDLIGKKPANDTLDIQEATTKEIEANTSLTYHKNVFVNRLVSYLNLRQVERATDFLEAYKASKEFESIGMKFGEGIAPKNWTTSINPSFRGYMLNPRVANVMDKYASSMMKGKDPLRALTAMNAFLRTAIFFNPLIHIPNIGIHWLVNRGATKFVNPMAYKRLITTSARAINAVAHQNKDYIDMLNSGAPLLYSSQNTRNMHNLLYAKMQAEIEKNPKLDFLKKSLKAINPYVLSGKATWMVNDIAIMQAIYEEMETQKVPIEQAIKDVGAHIPNYRLPANKVVELLTNPNITMFGAYHYGALRSYYEMAKTLVSGNTEGATNETRKERNKARADTLDKILMMGIIAIVLYPAIDRALQKATGNPDAKLRRAGAVTFPYNLIQVASGQQDISQFIQSVITPAVGSKELVSQIFNLDLFTGQHIRDTSATAGQEFNEAVAHAEKAIAPVAQYQKLDTGSQSVSQFLLSLTGVSSPDRAKSSIANKVQAAQLKVDRLDDAAVARVTDVYNQAKEAGFGTLKADQLVADLNSADYNIYKDLKAIDLAKRELELVDKVKPIVQEANKLGFGTPEADKLVNDLSDEEFNAYTDIKKSLYGTDQNELPTYADNSEHDEKGFINSIVTYAKAFGVDPITAFKDIFKGQVIRKVNNDTIIVERMSVAQSQAVKKRGGGNNKDMKLDHTLPLQLGGTNEESNLKLVTTEEWASYTPVEDYLGRALTNKQVDKKTAQNLITQFKNKEITFDEVKSEVEK